jgi:hypothetical protein
MFNVEQIHDAHIWCNNQVFSALKIGNDVVVSNTFSRLWEFEDYIDYCNENNIEFEVIECNGNFKNIHNCPEETINKMKSRWQEYKKEDTNE